MKQGLTLTVTKTIRQALTEGWRDKEDGVKDAHKVARNLGSRVRDADATATGSIIKKSEPQRQWGYPRLRLWLLAP